MINLHMDPNVYLLSILPLLAAQTIWVVLPLSILQLIATNNTVAAIHKLVVLPLSTLQLLMANTKITVNLSKDVVTLQLIANKETTMVDVLQAAMVKVTDMADKVVLTEVMVVKADMVLVTTDVMEAMDAMEVTVGTCLI